MTSLDRSYHIIKAPILTEKATDDQQKRNAYHFRVPIDANKVEIRGAVERLFKVKVQSVNTVRPPVKARRRGWVAGTTGQYKKALVVLREGDTIDLL